MNRRKFLQCSASVLAVGSGLALAGCGDRSTDDAAFTPCPNDPVRPENFTNPLFIRKPTLSTA